MRSHEWIDRRSLALHEAVATKLEAQPQLLDVARANLQRWLRTNPSAALREWRQVLEGTTLPALLALLRSTGDEAARLRQSSPFAGLLTVEERQAILNDRVLLRERMAAPPALRERLSTIAIPPDRMQALQDRLRRVERTSGLDPHE